MTDQPSFPTDPTIPPQAAMPTAPMAATGPPPAVFTPGPGFPIAESPSSGGGKRTLLIMVGVVVVALLIGGVFIGMRLMNANKAVVIPSALGGLSKTTDPTLSKAADTMRTGMAQGAKFEKFDAAAYGATGSDAAFLLVAREGGSMNELFDGVRKGGLAVSQLVKVGKDTCATATNSPLVVCARSEGQLVVAVLATGADTNATAAMVEQAWALQ